MKSIADNLKRKNKKNPQRRLSSQKVLISVALVISLLSVLYWVFRTVQASPSADIRVFLESYFSTWSAGDLKAYRSHFYEDAHIFYISSRPYTINSLDLN